MKQINGFVIISLILAVAYFIGLIFFLSENEEDKCEMTYMFEYPQYVKISNEVDKHFKKYGLYAYSEGRHTEKIRNMLFDGIPVLFIPGNAGSHKQVRSLSSIALRKWLNSRTPFYFDYFTVDLNEEYSGLYGPLLFDQLNYVNASLYRILELYSKKQNPPESVVVVGHSMGGVIAMKLLSELKKPELIPIIITLASPLKRPLLSLDYHMNKFYEGMFYYDFKTTNVISIAGGYKDILITPFLTEKRENFVMRVETTHIPVAWTECTHVQILWCKQVIMALNRALFDSVDPKTYQISNNATFREMVFEHHLVQHSGTKIKNRDNYFKSIKMNSKGKWIENVRKVYSIEYPNGITVPHWYMTALTDVAGYEVLTILAINLEVTDWVFVCNAYFFKQSSRICQEGFHLSQKSQIAPSIKYKRRFFRVNMADLKKYRKDLTHIVYRALPTDEPLEYHVDIHGSDQRSLTVNLPGWLSFFNKIVLDKTEEKALFYEVLLPELNHISQYYRLMLEPVECSKNEHHASITLSVPWSNEDSHGFITNNIKKPFSIRLYSSRPYEFANMSAVIKLILDPSCRYKISIKSSVFDGLSQLARIYSPLLLANVAAVALMSLRYQLKNLEEGHCSILFVAIQEGAKLYYVLPAYNVLSRFLCLPFLPDVLLKPDHMYLVNDRIDFFLLPPLIYICSVGIFWLLVMIFSICLIVMESTVHKISAKLLARSVSFNMALSDYLMSYLHKVPVVVALTLISLSLTTCGGLALCLGAVFYFLKLTQMSQDFVEEVVWYILKRFANKCKCYFFKNKGKKTQCKENTITNVTDVNTEEVPNRPAFEVEDMENTEDHDITDEETTIRSININETNISINLLDKETETNTSRGIQVTDEDNELIDNATKMSLTENREHGVEKEQNVKNITNFEDGDNPQILHKCKNSLEKDDITDSTDKELADVQPNSMESKTISNNKQRNNEKHGDDKYSKVSDKEPVLSTAYNAIFFHSTFFFLWCLVTVINIPAVLTWAHNFKYSTVLETDDSFIPGISLSICALMLWQCDFPKTNRKWIDKLEKFVMAMAVLSLVFATISIYRLNYLLTLTIIIVTLHQLFAPELEKTRSEDDLDEKSKYSDIKMKME